MYDTLEHGDRGFSFIITRNIKIKRFDICVIDSDKCHNLIIKRVIGLPNDKLVYANNKLYINGEELREEYLNGAITEDFEIQLKDDEYFVMGDNRQVSNDSRYYGTFKKDEIVATNFFVFYPFNRIGFK